MRRANNVPLLLLLGGGGRPICITIMIAIMTAATAQQGRPTIPGANHPVTYMLNRSTILMACNTSGLFSPASVKGWGIIDVDWSNAKVRENSARGIYI